ncbi:MAG: MFS transporter, partial [Candidatus Omnitrophica bacterium]|nr:MFS transporter [Candidatus Omnitrophota bacterium]
MNKKIFWIYALSSIVYFIQGFEGLPSQGLFYYLKETLNFPPERIMFLSSIITLAWLVKPLFGYIIDRFLNKKAWIFISLGLDIALVLVLFVFPLPVAPLIALLLFNSANSALRDVGVDGIMCVEGKKYALTGKIQSIQWISISVAILITGIGGGYIAHKWGFRSAFLFLIPFYLLAGVITNFYSEDKSAARNSGKTLISDLKRLFAHKQLMIVALFIFLYKYSPSFGTPLFFIQRDSFKWGKVWIGALSSIGTVFTIFGALLYYKFSKKINIRKWLYISVFL